MIYHLESYEMKKCRNTVGALGHDDLDEAQENSNNRMRGCDIEKVFDEV